MGLFDKLFGGGKRVPKGTAVSRGIYMPELNIPIDEKFTIHFKKNGGKFLYCDSFSEVCQALKNIVVENKWKDQPFFAMNSNLVNKFAKEGISFTDNCKESKIFFTSCENLIAQNGSILVCSNQLNEKKLNELPQNVIVFATTSQLVDSIGEGLKIIKKKHANSIPANITTLRHFKVSNTENSNDFMTYGTSSKNLYLLLLEDL